MFNCHQTTKISVYTTERIFSENICWRFNFFSINLNTREEKEISFSVSNENLIFLFKQLKNCKNCSGFSINTKMSSINLLWYTGLKDFELRRISFFSHVVLWWHRKMLAKVGLNGEHMATSSIWLYYFWSNKITFSLVLNKRISKTCCLLRPETVWLDLNNSLTHISIVLSRSGMFAERESTSREAMNNLELCWIKSLMKSKESLTV